jgi:uncharacterized protein YecT (DUF1311 family)
MLAGMPASAMAGEIPLCDMGDMGCLMQRAPQVEPSLDEAYTAEVDQEKAQYRSDPKMLKIVLANLEQSQAAFRTYRNAECASEALMAYGGSMERQLHAECRIRLTNARIRELNGLKGGLATWDGLR